MIWKTIGQSVIGSSHIQSGKICEDANLYQIVNLPNGDEALVCFISDGAGSAKFGGVAASAAVSSAVSQCAELLSAGEEISEHFLTAMSERIYDELLAMAVVAQVPKNEYSCTLLGCVILSEKAAFLQIGDGAIVREDGSGHFTLLWWPHNGEYQNSTAFLIDDPNLPHLNTKVVDDIVIEVALFSDGLQQLALNQVSMSVHQPFFNNVFPSLRKAQQEDHLSILNSMLLDYLSGEVINSRTDDDKTLVLATRA